MTADRQDVEKTIPSVKVKVPGLPIGRRRLQGQGTFFFEIFSESGGGYMGHLWRRLHGPLVAEVTWDKNPSIEAAALPKKFKKFPSFPWEIFQNFHKVPKFIKRGVKRAKKH